MEIFWRRVVKLVWVYDRLAFDVFSFSEPGCNSREQRFDNILFGLAIKQWGSVCLCSEQRHCVCQRRVLNNSKSGVNKVSREFNVLFNDKLFLELPFSHWRAIRKFAVLYNRHELKPIFREVLSILRLLLQIITPGVMVFSQYCNNQ